MGLFTPLPGAAFGAAGLAAEGAGLGAEGAGWVLGWGISMGSLGGMIVFGVRVGFASGIFSPWRYTLTWREERKTFKFMHFHMTAFKHNLIKAIYI